MEISYSYMSAADIPQVAELERQAFSQPWSEAGIGHYMESGHTVFIVAKHNEKAVAYAAVFCVLDEGNLVSIVVDDNYKRMGIASELLDIVYEEAIKAGIKSINLEVRKSNNAAILLYEKEGFEQVGLRKNFYDKPKEDALLFIRRLL